MQHRFQTLRRLSRDGSTACRIAGRWARWVLVLLWIPACTWAAQAVTPSAEDAVTIGVLQDFAPFYRSDATGRVEGFDADLVEAVAKQTGLRFTWRRYVTFADLQRALERGEVRVITAIAQTPARARSMRFTRPYATVQQAFVGRRTITSVPATPDLSGRRVAVVAGFVSENVAAERFPSAARPVYDTPAAALDAVQRGDADFVLEAQPVLQALLDQRNNPALGVLRTYGFPEGHLRLATRLADAELLRTLDQGLAALADSTLLPALRARWLPPPAPAAAASAPRSDAPPLRVGYLTQDRPFTFRQQDGSADGIAVRIMQRVAVRAGLSIESFRPMSLAEGLDALRTNRLDVMMGLTDTEERRRTLGFVGPYRVNPVVIVGRRQYAVWDLAQLTNKRLAMVRGYFARSYIRDAFPLIDIVECALPEECLAWVEQGRVEAALYGLQGTYERLGARAAADLQITGAIAGLYDEHNLGLSPARASLAPTLRDALQAAIVEDLPGIEARWASEQEARRVDWDRIWRIAGAGAGLLLLAAAALTLHLRRLRREVQRTEAARQESEQYLAFMAHEVRNALQSVSAAVVLLHERREPSVPDPVALATGAGYAGDAGHGVEWREPTTPGLVDMLGRSARSTLALLDSLLDRHRLHAGRLVPDARPAPLVRVVGTVVDDCAPMAAAKGLALKMDADPAADGDWQVDVLRLQQIVRNLLVNAVKFSDRGTLRVKISVETGAPDTAGVLLEVSDEGCGMSADQQERAFERFGNSGGDRPGSGLGLHLCRDLATALGGSLVVESRLGEGSRFLLRLPLRRPDTPPAPPQRTSRVVVIEDSDVYALMLQAAFARRGIDAVRLDSLQAARVWAQSGQVSRHRAEDGWLLVLADCHLPDGDADQLLREWVEHGDFTVAGVVYVFMSATVDEGLRERVRRAGALELLAKEPDVAAFVDRVMRLLPHEIQAPAPAPSPAPPPGAARQPGSVSSR